MTDGKKRLALILRQTLHQLCYEIQMHYTNHDLAIFVEADDSTLTTFRLALQELRARNVEPTDRILHVEKRMKKAYRKWFNEPLPQLNEEEVLSSRL